MQAFLLELFALLGLGAIGAARFAADPRLRARERSPAVRRTDRAVAAATALAALGMVGAIAVRHGVVPRTMLGPSGLAMVAGAVMLVVLLVVRVGRTGTNRRSRKRV